MEREIDNLPVDARYRERKLHDMTLRLDVKERLLFASPFCNYIFAIQQTDSELPFEEKVKLYYMQMLG